MKAIINSKNLSYYLKRSALLLVIGLVWGACKPTFKTVLSAKSNQLQVDSVMLAQNNIIVATVGGYDYAIYIAHLEGKTYSVLQMKCSYHDCELEVSKKILKCPCHGCQFTNTGRVLKSPSTMPLLKYRSSYNKDRLNIELY